MKGEGAGRYPPSWDGIGEELNRSWGEAPWKLGGIQEDGREPQGGDRELGSSGWGMAATSKLEAVEKLTDEGKLPTLIYTGAPGQKAARWPTPGMTDLGDKLH